MGLGKQAKTLTKGQIDAMLAYLSTTRHPARNRLIFLLSAKTGLRAKEIARLTWWMTNYSQGEIGRTICLQDSASKGKSGRMIPLSNEVREALIEYRRTVPHAGPNVISTERSLATSAQAIVNLFHRWYRHLGFVGCSSHIASELCVVMPELKTKGCAVPVTDSDDKELYRTPLNPIPAWMKARH